jgi:hypothetical protein
MIANYRSFEAGPDPFSRMWQVEFQWLQTAISIRHSDSVDVKFLVTHGNDRMEKVIALPHADLLTLSARSGHPLTDPWCMKLAALHLVRMIETSEDMDKTIVTPALEELAAYQNALVAGVAA